MAKNVGKKEQSNKTKIIPFIFFVLVLIFVFGGHLLNKLRTDNDKNPPKGTGDELAVVAIEMSSKYGDSTLIKYNNYEILVDAGTSSDKAYVQDALKEYVTDKTLDLLIVSHAHADHIGAMTDVSFFDDIDIDVSKIVDTGHEVKSNTTSETVSQKYNKMCDELVSRGAEKLEYFDIINDKNIETVWNIDTEGKIFLEFFDTGNILEPTTLKSDDLNDTSIVFVLNYNNTKWFFGGDLTCDCEEDLVKNIKGVDKDYFTKENNVVYKTCHHGSETSNGELLLDFVKPDIIFTMSGFVSGESKDDPIKDQHPYFTALERMKKYTEKIYWSSINGQIIFTTIGEEIEFDAKGRTHDYYYNGEIVNKEEEKLVTIFESKWYLALKALSPQEENKLSE